MSRCWGWAVYIHTPVTSTKNGMNFLWPNFGLEVPCGVSTATLQHMHKPNFGPRQRFQNAMFLKSNSTMDVDEPTLQDNCVFWYQLVWELGRVVRSEVSGRQRHGYSLLHVHEPTTGPWTLPCGYMANMFYLNGVIRCYSCSRIIKHWILGNN